MKKLFLMSIVLINGLFFGCSIKEVKLPEAHKIDTPSIYSCSTLPLIKKSNNEEYSEQEKEIAKKYFIYALFSSNSYKDKAYFSIPNWKRVKRYTAHTGFSADVYEKTINSKIEEVVIAFRGTNGLFFDSLFANLTFSKNGQYKNSDNLFDKILENKRYTSVKKVVVGHSLGGGLALHVSAKYDNVDAYVFNPSPRLFIDKNDEVKKNKRIIIHEEGEILEKISKVLKNALKKIDYDIYAYDFFDKHLFKSHSIYPLARGLLLLSAVNNDELAIEIQNEIAHCGFKFDENKTE